jgi:integrase
MAITDKWLKAHLNKPSEKRFEKAHRDGLSVRVSKTGVISFQYRYYLRETKKRDYLTIGNYPQVTLAKAVKEMDKHKAILSEGKNPRLEQKSSFIFEATKITIKEMWTKWYDIRCITKANPHEINRSFEIYVEPSYGKLIAGNVSKGTWLALLNPLIPKVPSIVERLIINLKQCYEWSVDQTLVPTNPVKDIFAAKLGIEKGFDDRNLELHELVWFWKSIEKTRVLERTKILIQLALFYGCRPKELRLAEMSELNFDFGLWTIPWTKHKTGKKTKQPLVRPIIKEVEHLWKRAIELSDSKTYVFTIKENNKVIPISTNAVASAVKNLVTYWSRRIKDKGGEPIQFEHWSIYSLRKTARSNFSDFGDWAVCEKMIGHKMPGEADKYDFNKYAVKMTPIYTQWWERLMKLKESKNGQNIISLKERLEA